MPTLPTRRLHRLPLDDYRSGHAFHVTINTYDKRPWFDDEALTKEAVVLLEQSPGVYAWCILPDHVHVLLTAPDLVGWVQGVQGEAHICVSAAPSR